MNFRFVAKVALILLIPYQVTAVEVSFETLRHQIETKNSKVLGQIKKVTAAQKREGYLFRSFLPEVSVSGGYETFNARGSISGQQPYFNIESSINLYNGGKDRLQEEIIGLNSEIKKYEVKVSITKELGKARELFWKVIYFKKEKELLIEMKDINEKNLKSANRRIKSGIATPSDRLEFEMKRLDLNRSIAQAEAKVKALSYDLVVHLGYEVDEPLSVEGELIHFDEWEQDLEHSHGDHDFFTKPRELLAQELKLESLQSKRAWAPKVDLYAGWYQFNQREEASIVERERQESAVGVRLTMSLFDRFSAESETEALKLEASAALDVSRHFKRKNEAHIEKEFLELKTLHEQVHEAEKHIAMADKYYKATQSEYSRGAKNSPDVLSATERLEKVMRTKYELIREFQIARSHVLSKMGK